MLKPLPLHVKSDHSFGRAVGTAAELAESAAGAGLGAIALTDAGTLAAQVEFHEACRAHNVRAITGAEFPVRGSSGSDGRIVVLARDVRGYRSLCRLVTESNRRARDGVALLQGEDAPEHLFVLTDEPSAARALLAHGFDRASLGLLLVRISDAIPRAKDIALAGASLELRVVADVDAVMPHDDDAALLALSAAVHARIGKRRPLRPCAQALTTPPALFDAFPDAVRNTHAIAEACTLDLTTLRPPFDEHVVDHTATLTTRCRQWTPPTGAHAARLRRELAVIAELGLARYFLAVAEIAGEARRRGISVTARGSAVSSLVVHALGLTPVDPLALGLYFERFVRASRKTPPDIDLDVASDRRNELIEWTHERFGASHVAAVGTYQTFRLRSAYRDALPVLGMRAAEVERFTTAFADDELELPAPTELLPERFRRDAPLIERLIARPRHLATHPSALALSAAPLADTTPLVRAPKGGLVTQLDGHALSHLGLLKVDLLGNRSLAEVDEVAALLRGPATPSSSAPTPLDARDDALDVPSNAFDVPDDALALDVPNDAFDAPDGAFDAPRIGLGLARPLDDARTLAAIGRGDTVGCSQLESPVMRSVLRRLPITRYADVVAAIALVRPGPGSGPSKETFIRRARGEETASLFEPRLDGVLDETHGVMLYEENVIAVIERTLACSAEDADELRAAIVRGEDVHRTFCKRAVAAGVAPVDAERIGAELARFAAYSFSKAHAASVALVAYRSAYARVHHTSEFACAVLNHHGGLYPIRTVAAALVRAGVELRAPDVTVSEMRTVREGRAARIGLDALRHVGEAAKRAVLSARAAAPFLSLSDLVARVPMTDREFAAFVLSGACDQLPPLSAETYPFAHEAVLGAAPTPSAHAGTAPTPNARAGTAPTPNARAGTAPERLELYRALVRANNELRYLEMHPSAHPMKLLRDEARRAGALTTAEAEAHAGTRIRLAAVVAALRRIRTARGDVMQFVTLEDEEGLLEAVVPPTAYAELGDPIKMAGPYLVEGAVERSSGTTTVVVDAVKPFHRRHRPYDAG
ncbi:MAG TPA: PHP domain-containing protein [Polyangiaceae bacterium]|jgi:DNA polymerase III alpha subunit|nr:PHP domain-containing protein [Polyangiaceae bacterium]